MGIEIVTETNHGSLKKSQISHRIRREIEIKIWEISEVLIWKLFLVPEEEDESDVKEDSEDKHWDNRVSKKRSSRFYGEFRGSHSSRRKFQPLILEAMQV